MVGLVGIDFETHLISQEMPNPKPICLSYYDGTNSGILVGKDIEEYLHKILSSDAKIIAHNMSFEANVIDTWYPQLRGLLRAK